MSVSSSGAHDLSTCGCCEAGAEERGHANRHGLPALSYRLGTQSTFLSRMLARLPAERVSGGPNEGVRPLAALTTRAGDDPAVALLDAWATAADVLAFYQERIANEAYLQTATERRSVLELARSIGYELNPGVAASTYLAFTVDDSSGAPGTATVSESTKVLSLPTGGDLPQTFETSEQIEARAVWNELKPRTTQPQEIQFGYYATMALVGTDGATIPIRQLYVKGTQTGIKPGDPLLLYWTAFNYPAWAMLRVRAVIVETASDRTRLDLERDDDPYLEQVPSIPPFDIGSPAPVETIDTDVDFNDDNVEDYILNQSWKEQGLASFMEMNGWDEQDLLDYLEGVSSAEDLPNWHGVFAFKQRLGFLGHNAPAYATLPDAVVEQFSPYPQDWDLSTFSIWRDPNSWPLANWSDADVYLERTVPELVPDSWVIFEKPDGTSAYRLAGLHEASIAACGISGKAVGLELHNAWGHPSVSKAHTKNLRTMSAHVKSERLELAELPIEEDVEDAVVMLEGLVLGLEEGRHVAVSGEDADAPGVVRSEVVVLAEVLHIGGYTTLYFQTGLTYRYIRDTVTLNANVVPATHGETVEEVLGSGDGAQANQSFELSGSPLTYVSAATTSGGQSTLAVRVNGILWDEASSLYGADADSRVYISRLDDDGVTSVVFGDGVNGARLPSGQENVVATYRTGIGADGKVDAGALTLLQTRPPGVREVANPVSATGAADPESLDDARANSPLTVLTLERIVSLQDFESFAGAFAGIGKAQASAVWNGEGDVVHITVAGEDGDQVTSGPGLHENLVAAIDAVRDPTRQVTLGSYDPLFFYVGARVLVDSSYTASNVLEAAEAHLLETFSFETREFGQPVSAAEVMAEIQGVDGVTAVDLDELYSTGAADLNTLLQSQPARWDDPVVLPAQLLTIDPAGIFLTEM